MLLKPKFIKFPKSHKGRFSYVIKTNQSFTYGKYALVSTQPGRLRANHIAAAELAIKRSLKKDGQYWLRLFPHIPVSKKPAEVRMGKGKGSVDHWMCRIRSGAFLFELSCSSPELAKTALLAAASKLPICAKFISS